MGAGQIGGIATLMDLDFNNAAGFIGVKADTTEAQYMIYFLSHAMMFCAGSLIEAHVVLTAASCVYGERFKFEVFAGSHTFLEHAGISRSVDHMCIHKGYNHTVRWESCSPDNLALLLLNSQFKFNTRESGTEYIVNRLRYGIINKQAPKIISECKFFGWGSRRNGYLVPLLLHLRRVEVEIMPKENCQQMWNYGEKYLCLQQKPCISEEHGALCPDDVGTVLECGGFLRGLMATRLIDRPCGIGFLDMGKYLKFLTCGVDDARDIIGHNDIMEFEFDYTTFPPPHTPSVETVTPDHNIIPIDEGAPGDPGPPKEDKKEDESGLEYEPDNGEGNTRSTVPPEPMRIAQQLPAIFSGDKTF